MVLILDGPLKLISAVRSKPLAINYILKKVTLPRKQDSVVEQKMYYKNNIYYEVVSGSLAGSSVVSFASDTT
jgi:hypothetical protein